MFAKCIIHLRSTPVVATKCATGEVSNPVIGPAWYEYILSGAWLCDTKEDTSNP